MADDVFIEAAKAGDAARIRKLLNENGSWAVWRAPTGETPLMAALYRGHRELAHELADALVRSGRRLDVFASAALGRSADLSAALDEAPVVNTFAYDGWTPLHLAAFFGQRDAVELLLASRADLGAVSRNSLANTPLHAAVAGGHVDVSLLLIERGADVNAADAGGHTPLHIAAEGGYLPVVRALLARGADPHAVDAEDKTPLSRAASRNHTSIIDEINVER
jgi:ankyrin repeat protein